MLIPNGFIYNSLDVLDCSKQHSWFIYIFYDDINRIITGTEVFIYDGISLYSIKCRFICNSYLLFLTTIKSVKQNHYPESGQYPFSSLLCVSVFSDRSLNWNKSINYKQTFSNAHTANIFKSIMAGRIQALGRLLRWK